MIRHEIKTFADINATILDKTNQIRSAYTIILQNINASGYIYLGGENVSSTSYGYRLYPGQGITLEMPAAGFLYGAAETVGMQVSIMEIDRAI